MDLASLRSAVAGGARPEFVPFWGTDPEPGDVHVFSQWFPAPFRVGGVRYATAEHWMMAAKARTFGDTGALARVLADDDPAAAKQAGREVRGFDSATWDRERYAVVVDGNRAKFGAGDRLTDALLGTGDAVLVEASPVDRIWGIGLAAGDPALADPARWPGRNLLGFALMAVRAELRRRPPA
ncbi:NADAR family protein [Pseudonocardia spirodelae]|uniref:NADAR family protein n=1 Tax=Pseudonocardia spirodelae TaxID=3133431 RepID=A0ABU8T194_9PSEU